MDRTIIGSVNLEMSVRLHRAALVVLVLGIAAILRFSGWNWDDRTYPHPDERFITTVTGELHTGRLTLTDRDEAAREPHRARCLARNPTTKGIGGWFDSECSDFNPANTGNASYPYGQLPLTFVRIIAEGVAAVTGWTWATHYGGIHIVGRMVSAGIDLFTLLATFLLGRLVWGRAVGLLGATFYAFAALPIQSAHYWTVDSGATCIATVCIIFLVRIVRFGHAADVIAFGVAYGFALATKMSLLPIFLLLPLAAWWAPQQIGFTGSPERLLRIRLAVADVVIAIVAAGISFRLASPYAFVGPEWFNIMPAQGFLDLMAELRGIVLGIADIPPSWQWLGRTAWLSPGRDLMLWGLGLPLALAALIGVLRSGWRLLEGTPRQRIRAVPWLWVVGYFLWIGQQWQSTMRYLLPIYPGLCLFAAAWLVTWWRGRRRWKPAERRAYGLHGLLPHITLGIVTGATLWWAFAFHGVFTTLHSYVAATHWYLRNVPAAVAAPISTASGGTVFINWAAGNVGSGIPPRTMHTVAPASGSVNRLRLNHVAWKSGTRAPRVLCRVLDGEGKLLAVSASQSLEFPANPADARASTALLGVELALPEPLAITGGRPYRLEVEVTDAVIEITGTAIAHEGGWNDPLPMRTPWLPSSDALNLSGASGTTSHDAPVVDAFGDKYYRSLEFNLVEEDNEVKRERMLAILQEAQWISIPNNRLYDSITLNPLRFPLTTRFYDALFSGKLGFDREVTIVSVPRFLGVSLEDQAVPAPGQGVTDPERHKQWASEEAFTVYDHPAVFIFRKGAAYSQLNAARVLEAVNLVDVETALRSDTLSTAGRLKWSSLEASLAPDGLLLPWTAATAHAPTQALAAASPASETPIFASVLLWYVISLLLGWIAWPWLGTLWPGLPDRGCATARIAGLLALAGGAWWLTWLGLPAWSTRALTILLLSLLVPTTLLIAKRLREPLDRIWLRNLLRHIVLTESIFLTLFLIGIGLRITNPDLWAPWLGGEKLMDFAMLNSILGTSNFPPPDPWFSGGHINYYYFGWVLVAVLIKLTGVTPAVGYNLAVATWYAMTGVAAFGVAWNMCAAQRNAMRIKLKKDVATPLFAGLIALLATVVMGNLDLPRAVKNNFNAVQELLQRPQPLDVASLGTALTQDPLRWFWAPSRTVGERPGASFEVNEFPAFSFILGDLHPHVMAMPLQLLLLTALLAVAWPASGQPRRALVVMQVVVLAFAVGFLRATNSWDWPLYLVLSTLAAIAAGHRLEATLPHGQYRPKGRYEGWGRIGLLVGLLLGVQAIVALPFTAHFATGLVEVRRFTGAPTPLTAWLTMQGWFLAALLPWAWRLSRQALPESVPANRYAASGLRILRFMRWSGLAYTVLASVWVLISGKGEVAAFGMQAASFAWVGELFLRNTGRRTEAAALAAACLGLALDLAVELIVIGQDMGRMNTFFKFQLQAWILFSVASGVAVASLIRGNIARSLRRPSAGPIVILTILALAYFPLAIYGRIHSRFDPHIAMTLDGEAFLADAVFQFHGQPLTLADDYRIIRWLRANASPSDTVLEAQLPEYQWGSRISAFTGLPTLLGYRYHQTQQRPLAELHRAVELRRANVAKLYGGADSESTLRALCDYRVRFVVVGGLERAAYPQAGLAKFAALAQAGRLRTVFSNGEDRVYEVPDAESKGQSWPVF